MEVSDEVTEHEEDDDECMIVGEETVKRVGDDFPMVSSVSYSTGATILWDGFDNRITGFCS